MLRGGWREHVRAQLQKRERGVWALRALLERHEKLQERLEAQQAFLEATLKARAGGGYCGPPWEQLRREAEEVRELRREREELRQQVALLTEIVRETEVKNQEQQARMRPLAQSLTAVTRQYEEAQCKAWLLSQEVEGMRRGLEETQQLLAEAQRERQGLEARWVAEKALEAKRLNRANEQEEKYRQKILRLREKLQKANEAAPC